MASTKATILLIPGAFHTPAYFDPLRSELEAKSYPTVSHQIPSLGSTENPDSHTAHSDAIFIRSRVLEPLLDEGKRVVIAMHSYGGVPGSAAAYGLSEYERQKEGLQGGVVGLVYLAAFVVPVGTTLADMKPPPLTGQAVTKDGIVSMSPEGAKISFHNDFPELASASFLRPMPFSPFNNPVSTSAHEQPEFQHRMYYVHCTEDRAIPLELQQSMVRIAGIQRTVTLETDHTPHLGKTKEVADVIMEAARGAESQS